MNAKTRFITPLLFVCWFSPASAEVTLDEFKECARMAGQEQRTACFEFLSQRLAEQENASTTDAAVATTAAVESQGELASLPDSIGGGEFAEAAGVKKASYKGHVKSCKKSADRRWFYIFDNGQVWKQVDRRKRRHKNCNFDVVLTEDTFGYVMQIEGNDSKIRVDRKR